MADAYFNVGPTNVGYLFGHILWFIFQSVLHRMEEDATNILSYMASNGLIANACKTFLVILNLKKKDKEPNNPISVTIGGMKVTQVDMDMVSHRCSMD